MIKSTLKIARCCPLVIQGFSNFCFKWLWQTPIYKCKYVYQLGVVSHPSSVVLTASSLVGSYKAEHVFIPWSCCCCAESTLALFQWRIGIYQRIKMRLDRLETVDVILHWDTWAPTNDWYLSRVSLGITMFFLELFCTKGFPNPIDLDFRSPTM